MSADLSSITLAVAAALVALIGFGFSAQADLDVAQPAPSLVVQELDGQTFDLGAAHGRVVVVSFWATWCPPCRAEMPALNAVYRRYHAQGLDVIGLSADHAHDKRDVIKTMQSFSYPAAMLDDAARNGFGTPSSLPLTIVVDRNGIIRAELTPDKTPVTEKSLSDAIVPLLGGNTSAH